MTMLLQLLGFVAGLALVFIYAQRYLRRRNLCLENGCLPPPKMRHRDRIFGIDTMAESYQHVCDKTYLHECVSRFEKYGWTYEQRITGTTMINTCEPANVKAILGTQFTNFTLGDRRKNAFVPLLGHGIFTTDGSPWSHSRSVLRPSFAKDHISNIAVLDKHVSNLITAIEHRQRHHGSCDIRSFFFSLTLDVATELFFGASCQSLRSAAPSEDEESTRFAEAFNRGQQKIAEDFALGSLAALRPRANKEFKADRDVIHGFIDSYVERAVAKATRGKQLPDDEGYESDDKKSYIVLDEMAKQTSDVKQLRSELLNLMLAARDTTASLLSNLFFILARRPDVWSKLKAEVDTLNGEQPEFSKLKDMKYLQYCMKESLRMHPPIPRNSRTAIQDTVLPRGGGPDGTAPLFVPAGQIISYNAYCMHRRSDLWKRPNEFRPQRWDGMRTGWEYLPFNGGPRVCLGQQLALTEAGYTIVRLLQHFPYIEPCGSDDWQESLTITVCPEECEIALGTVEGDTQLHSPRATKERMDGRADSGIDVSGQLQPQTDGGAESRARSPQAAMGQEVVQH